MMAIQFVQRRASVQGQGIGAPKGLLVLAALTLAGTACAPAAADAPPQAVTERPAASIRAETLAPVTDRATIRAAGRLTARDEARLSFKIGGVVKRVSVDDGARVQAGQLLAALDTVEMDAAVRQAEAALAKAERDLARATSLEDAGASSRQLREDATTARDVAREQLTVARFNRRHAEIQAPFSGRVFKRLVEAGELIGPGMPVLVLSSDERDGGLEVEVGVVDRDAVQLAAGGAATVTVDATGVSFAAEIEDVAPSPLPGSVTYVVRLAPRREPDRPDATAGLLAGMTVKASLTAAAERSRVVLPLAALVAVDGDVARVFSVEKGRAVSRQVKLGPVTPSGVELVDADNLTGARVVTAGAGWLRDGDRVVEGSGRE